MALQIGGRVPSAPGADCRAWNELLRVLQAASAQKNYEAVDAVEGSLNRLAIKIMADPRRVAAVRAGCAGHFADIQRRGQPAATARQIADPAHDPALLESWIKSLSDEAVSELAAAAKAELAARKKANTKKKP